VKIGDILVKESIVLDLRAREKRDALAEMAKALAEGKSGLDQKRVFRALHDREELQSTGIGEGVAVPHCKLPDLSHPVTSFARSREGVDFRASDGQPSHLFFPLVVPEGSEGQHLKILARISRYLHDARFRERLWEARTPEDVFRAVEEEDAIF
jgi:fructose-specific phosphotransferase system IIA component